MATTDDIRVQRLAALAAQREQERVEASAAMARMVRLRRSEQERHAAREAWRKAKADALRARADSVEAGGEG